MTRQISSWSSLIVLTAILKITDVIIYGCKFITGQVLILLGSADWYSLGRMECQGWKGVSFIVSNEKIDTRTLPLLDLPKAER
jgi:hypothetical protein